jgi:HD-like signal output (HDOD) protein
MTPQSLIAGSMNLLSLPEVFLRVNSLINEGTASFQEIAAAAALDPALAARMLKIVNSPYYGRAARIDTLSRAIAIIGLEDFYHLLLSVSAAETFRKIPPHLLTLGDVWLHSVHCAVIARQVARASSVLHAERFFVAGLLHRVGSLILCQRCPEPMRELLQDAEGRSARLVELEQERFGFTHADVGAALAQAWGLPESLRWTIGAYLDPERAGAYAYDAGLLHLAWGLKNLELEGDDVREGLPFLLSRVSEWLAPEESLLLTVLAEAPPRIEETLRFFSPARVR